MKIGICDDEKEHALKTKSVVDASVCNVDDYKVVLYDPHNLDFDLDANKFDCDLLITDIQFDNCSFDGIDLVHKINEKMPDCKIIFLSNFLEYGPEVYATEHVWFVWKKNMKILLRKAIQKAILKGTEDAKSDTIDFFSEGKKCFIKQRDIICAERSDRHVEIVTDNKTYVCGLSLVDLLECLNSDFERANGGCIVNLRFVRSVIGKTVELENHKKLILGRKFEVPFKQAYLDFITKRM